MVASLPAPSIRPVSLLAVHSSTGLRARVLRILAAPMTGSWRSSGAIAIAAALLPVCAAWSVGGVRLVEAHSIPKAIARLAPPVVDAVTEFPDSRAFDQRPALRDARLPRPAHVRMSQAEARDRIRLESASRATPVSALDDWRSPVAPSAPARPPEHDLMSSLTALGLPIEISAYAIPSPVGSSARVEPEPMPTVAAQAATPNTAPAAPTAALPATPVTAQPTPPWELAADAGKNLGLRTAQAAVATAGFFSRLGKSVARSF
jgi:hypothetical protein